MKNSLSSRHVLSQSVPQKIVRKSPILYCWHCISPLVIGESLTLINLHIYIYDVVPKEPYWFITSVATYSFYSQISPLFPVSFSLCFIVFFLFLLNFAILAINCNILLQGFPWGITAQKLSRVADCILFFLHSSFSSFYWIYTIYIYILMDLEIA